MSTSAGNRLSVDRPSQGPRKSPRSSPRGGDRNRTSPSPRGSTSTSQQPARSPRGSYGGAAHENHNQYKTNYAQEYGNPRGNMVGAPVAGSSHNHSQQQGNYKGYDEVPKADCCYSNENDPRSCVCVQDSCGRRNCTPNLATTNGKIIACSTWVGIPVTFLIFRFAIGGDKEGEEEPQERDRRSLAFMSKSGGGIMGIGRSSGNSAAVMSTNANAGLVMAVPPDEAGALVDAAEDAQHHPSELAMNFVSSVVAALWNRATGTKED
ncbi:unnamed protein product [Amoebophrya sp. A120]|nr:unnamed protein product [Amoebophrya sp. A120]|eukprot:GSA120T00021448001.1